jgi:hypothetical protein
MKFVRTYEERILPYLSTTAGNVFLVGADSKSVKLDPMMVKIAFPGTIGMSDILAPEAPFESIVEVANLIYNGR